MPLPCQFSRLPAILFVAAISWPLSVSPVSSQQRNDSRIGEAFRVVNTVTAASPLASAAEAAIEGEPVVFSASASPSNKKFASDRKLTTKDDVFASERVSAQPDSFAEILLNDDSKLLVGEGSTVFLDDFVVEGGGLQSATVNVAKGAFRFVSGANKRATYTVRTPLSTIGVRGTVFDVYVRDGGATDVVLLRGAVTVCAVNGGCRQVQRACDITRVSTPRQVEAEPFLRSAARGRGEESRSFHMTESQSRYSRGWRAPLVACAQRAAVESRGNADGGGNDGSSGTGGGSTGGGSTGGGAAGGGQGGGTGGRG